jgi:predicted CoA-binding protein
MTTKAAIQEFLSLKVLAVAGASRNTAKFGYTIFHDLKTRGYTVYPINPNAETIDGEKCYPSLAALPQKPDGIVIVTPPAQSEALVREAGKAGIQHVWLQQGADSPAAIKFCEQNGLKVVAGECIFMYFEPTAWFHGAHRWINSVIGKGPQ